MIRVDNIYYISIAYFEFSLSYYPWRSVRIRAGLEPVARDRCLLLRTGIRFGVAMLDFFRRLLLHYGIYRRYPLSPLPALKNAWRIART